MNVERPASESEAAALVADAADRRATIEIVGGGTRRGVGRPVAADRVVSTSGLAGIVAHNPAEMVMTALAGTPVAEIEAVLAARRQRLAFEPPDHRALLATAGTPTIGAVAAANLSGPRRLAAGAARDALIGLRFVNGRGEVLRSGGKVMKNVTGLDLVKLLAGSWGTLGLITEVTFKLQPMPETETTLVLSGLTDDAAIAVLAHAMASSAEVSGAAHVPEPLAARLAGGALGGASATLLRLEGFAESVAIRAALLEERFAALGPLTRHGDGQSAALWRDIRDVSPFAGRTQPLWRVSLKPSAGPAFALDLRRAAPATLFFDWQGGLVWAQMQDDAEAATMRRLVRAHGGGHATLWRGPEALRLAVPPFEPPPPALAALSARVKAALDPAGLFNPGRLGA